MLLYVVLQIIIPAFQLTQPRPARFGWQMYAGVSQPVAFTIVYPDGATAPVRLADYVGRVRADTDLERYLPPAICARERRAVAVRYRIIPERGLREVGCER
jgi:hypothetical protein